MSHRKPTALRVIEGNPGKRSMNSREPKPPSAGLALTPPPHLSKHAKTEWRRVLKDLVEAGMVARVDRAPLAVYCQLYGRWRDAEDALAKAAARDPTSHGLLLRTSNGNIVQSPLVGAANKAAAVALRAAAELGMTPAARAALKVEPPGMPISQTSQSHGFFAD